MTTSEWLPIADLPHGAAGFSRLYDDYINDFRKLQQFYEHDFHSFQHIPAAAGQTAERCAHRELLADVLIEQNTAFGAGAKALENAAALRDPRTVCVVTGQQVGILGGPLYTFYKTVTALKLAAQLNEQFPSFRFVPVFWLEGEDHDFEEVRRVGVLNAESVPEAVVYGEEMKNPGAVGEMRLDGKLGKFYEELGRALANSEFKEPVLGLLRQAYSPDRTFNAAFAAFLTGLVGEQAGLLFISAHDRRLKRLLSPVFTKEIQEFPRVSQLIIEQSARLEERYHAQIKTKALNLFYFHKEGRYFIEPREHDFSLRGTRHFIPKEELLRVAAEEPELLSPNVALRPICQDTLLPTVVTVAGPSEIAYFAQLREVYRSFGIPMPTIYPRATATIVEERLEKILRRYELEVTDVFRGAESVNERVIGIVAEVKIDEMFDAAAKRIADQMNELTFGIREVDPTLLGALATAREKIDFHLGALREKVAAAQGRKHEAALRQVAKVTHTLFPNGNLQEREIGIVHFMNRHGLEFPRALAGELAIGRFTHQVIVL